MTPIAPPSTLDVKLERVLFCALLLAHLVPVWSFRFIPAQDGPAHLNNANAMLHYGETAHSAFAQYYVRNSKPDPNYISHVMLGALMTALPLLVAQKVLASGYLLLMPLATRYALAALGPGATRLSILVFPLVCNYLFEKGFYNFCYSVALFMLVVGYVLRHRADFGPRRALVLFGLSVPLYFSHPVSLGIAYVTVAALGVAPFVFRSAGSLRPRPSALLWPAIALAPTAALLAYFVLTQGGRSSHHFGPVQLAELLFSLSALYSFKKPELAVGAMMAATLSLATLVVLVGKFRRRDWRRGDDLLVAVLAWVPVYLMMPNVAAGGSWISTRLTLYPYLLIILWLGAQRLGVRVTRALQAIGAAAAVAIVAMHFVAYRQLNPYIDDYVTVAAHVGRDSTLLPICLSEYGLDAAGQRLSPRVKLFTQASGYLAAERDLIDLSNYEAITNYFPLRFRTEVDPRTSLYDREPEEDGPTPVPRILDYPLRTGGRGRIDYVLVWDMRKESPAGPMDAVWRDLADRYELTFTSPRGFAKLYRRRGG